MDFKNKFIRHARLRLLNICKPKLCLKTSLQISAQEAHYRREMAHNEKTIDVQGFIEKLLRTI